ncbi:MAG: TIGR02285 family protein [Syntrophaceae bacterium]|nr:TIGR02285 family protein [Syntrophaceae bacterium]
MLICFLSSASVLAEECEIFWIHPEQAPLSIKKGYGAGKGTIDRMETFFAKALKDCRHSYESGNYDRILRMIRKKENACCIPMYITPEREKFIVFSVPYQIVMSNALIVSDSGRKKLEPFIGPDGKVMLEDVVANGLRIGVAKGRIYRGIIDQIIEKHKNSPGIVEHPGPQQMVDSLIEMMIEGRIDALIAYPWEAQYVAKVKRVKVYSLPIAGMDDYGLTSVGCSKTKEGEEIIRRLNKIILEHRTTPEFMDFAEHWLDSAGLERHRVFTAREFTK